MPVRPGGSRFGGSTSPGRRPAHAHSHSSRNVGWGVRRIKQQLGRGGARLPWVV